MMEKQQQRDQQDGGHQQQQEQLLRVVHSQVQRIKQEEKVHETYQHQAADTRPVLRDVDRQRSRSPLGRVVARPAAISIGGDS